MCRRPAPGDRPGWERASPREGAESGRATPSPGRRRRFAGGRHRARRWPCEGGETQPPCGARDPRLLEGRSERKGEHTLRRLRGRTRGQGGATPRGVELMDSAGRSESSVAEYWEWKGAGSARGGPRNAPGRASSAGLASRTRSGCARDTNAAPAERQTEAIPCRAWRLRPTLGVTEPLFGGDEGRA